ncbi:class I SAM-dependent methyltransferase [Knoellia sp. S7-12]|uniref:class I SAM-dependent methyltransferase n=1 Tax=Knoellia sp. S7-12 TaxID=3126698 RepID=UPI0033681692
MRHSRSDEFDHALSSASTPGSHWSEFADDPNAAAALSHRAATLRAAWRPQIPDRSEFILERARGRRVLDIGCVAHDIERMRAPQWLHRRIAGVASSCLGVDVLPDGIEHMRKLGFEAVCHDLSTGPGPIEGMGKFDVIVAGELIEHVPSMDMLFESGKQLLADDGELIVTTPNPWAPHRVRAGQRGECWENADHILFAFPSGMAELADRHGLVLSEAATTTPEPLVPSKPREFAKEVRRRLLGRAWVRSGFATKGTPRTLSVPARGKLRRTLRLPGRPFVGETFVYVLRPPKA